jgi:hypothetical protein
METRKEKEVGLPSPWREVCASTWSIFDGEKSLIRFQ